MASSASFNNSPALAPPLRTCDAKCRFNIASSCKDRIALHSMFSVLSASPASSACSVKAWPVWHLKREGLLPRKRNNRNHSGELRTDLGERQAEIHMGIFKSAQWHAGRNRLFRILHDRRAAAELDCLQSRRAVVEITGEHHADQARSENKRRRTEKPMRLRAQATRSIS